MKKIITVLLILAAGTAVFASGAQEENDKGTVALNRSDDRRGEDRRDDYFEELEKLELEGVVKFESPVAELNVDGEDYTLMAPGARGYLDAISEGDDIAVTGYIMDADSMSGPRGRTQDGQRMQQDFEALEGNTVILVESVTIDGTIYELPWVNEDPADRNGKRGDRRDRRDRGMDRG